MRQSIINRLIQQVLFLEKILYPQKTSRQRYYQAKKSLSYSSEIEKSSLLSVSIINFLLL